MERFNKYEKHTAKQVEEYESMATELKDIKNEIGLKQKEAADTLDREVQNIREENKTNIELFDKKIADAAHTTSAIDDRVAAIEKIIVPKRLRKVLSLLSDRFKWLEDSIKSFFRRGRRWF